MTKANIDTLLPRKSLIDLETHVTDQFSLAGYKLKMVLDDIILAQYVDTPDNETVTRSGVLIPLNAETKAWRLGRIILAGPNCEFTKVGDVICFPNDKGIPVSNLNVDDIGVVKHGMFLNEDRIFGVCTPDTDDN